VGRRGRALPRLTANWPGAGSTNGSNWPGVAWRRERRRLDGRAGRARWRTCCDGQRAVARLAAPSTWRLCDGAIRGRSCSVLLRCVAVSEAWCASLCRATGATGQLVPEEIARRLLIWQAVAAIKRQRPQCACVPRARRGRASQCMTSSTSTQHSVDYSSSLLRTQVAIRRSSVPQAPAPSRASPLLAILPALAFSVGPLLAPSSWPGCKVQSPRSHASRRLPFQLHAHAHAHASALCADTPPARPRTHTRFPSAAAVSLPRPAASPLLHDTRPAEYTPEPMR
jgi:hypothetical protein